MPQIRLLFLWHMHQPFYKDLVSGEYRLPWVRLHALKDYYGMVKLLDEFPSVHQTFNLVPSLIAQIEDYVAGAARDPFYSVVAKPAGDLNENERRFALQYLFQANRAQMIGRYERYAELHQRFQAAGEDPAKAERYFSSHDFTDLQVLSQIAWFDEFFLDQPDIAELIKKGRNFSLADQRAMLDAQQRILASVLPAYASAAERGLIEISTSPFYHPILPLLYDTNIAKASSPNLPLPRNNFRHPEDATEQIERGLALHEKTFGKRPKGVWPSEGSVSNEALTLAGRLGVEWMATDEGVLGRSLNTLFERDGAGKLLGAGPQQLYNIYEYQQSESDDAPVRLVFRDHSLSDLIGFVYSGMAPQDAVNHFLHQVRESAKPVLAQGRDAVVSVILDGENAWEFYPKSGREFLRRLYDALQSGAEFEALTVSEAISRHRNFAPISSITPGSWINANFNVWIGAPEDNLSWDYLYAARKFYEENSKQAHIGDEQRHLSYEELLIAEGSDWNWWYGPEHHSANDADFDELYRKHLSNVYQALGATPPERLAQPIAGGIAHPEFVPQTSYIHPRMQRGGPGYFDWMGAATYIADRRSSAMHGKQFFLDAAYAGINETNLYGRLDFLGGHLAGDWVVTVHLGLQRAGDPAQRPAEFLLSIQLSDGLVRSYSFGEGSSQAQTQTQSQTTPGSNGAGKTQADGVTVLLTRVLEFKIPRAKLGARLGDRIDVRFTLWRDRMPVDALPLEGAIGVEIATEEELKYAAQFRW